MNRPPALTARKRKEIEALFLRDHGSDPFRGSGKDEDLQRVVAAGMEAMIEIKKIELRFHKRWVASFTEKNTTLVLAAIYGLEQDLATASNLDASRQEAIRRISMRALSVVSHNKIRAWLYDHGGSGFIAEANQRRALKEYLDEKLVELDRLVEAADESRLTAEDQQEPSPPMP